MSEQLKLKGKSRLFFDWMSENKDSLLDIGCAYSFMLNLLGTKSKKQFGLDFDLEKINEGKLRFSHIYYTGGSGEELPFKDINNYYLRYHRHYSLVNLKNMFGNNFEIGKVYYGGLFLNQIGFLIYKSIYVFLLLFKVNKDNRIFKRLVFWMDEITSWDFDHSFSRISDKLCIYAKKR